MYASKGHTEFAIRWIAFQTHKKRIQTNIFGFAKPLLSLQITNIIFRTLQPVENFFYLLLLSSHAFISLFRTQSTLSNMVEDYNRIVVRLIR